VARMQDDEQIALEYRTNSAGQCRFMVDIDVSQRDGEVALETWTTTLHSCSTGALPDPDALRESRRMLHEGDRQMRPANPRSKTRVPTSLLAATRNGKRARTR
jgi:hypothetical protein